MDLPDPGKLLMLGIVIIVLILAVQQVFFGG